MSGLVFDSMRALFPYSAVFMALAIVVTILVKNDKTSDEPEVNEGVADAE